jgi:hypothetical protein
MRGLRLVSLFLAVFGLSFRASCSGQPIVPPPSDSVVVSTTAVVVKDPVDPTASRLIPPEIKVARSAEACTSTALRGDGTDRGYLIIDQPGRTVAVDWDIDGKAFGSATFAPFVATANGEDPLVAPLEGLSVGTHVVRALLHMKDRTDLPIFTNIVVPEAVSVPAANFFAVADGVQQAVSDWEFLQGVVTFAANDNQTEYVGTWQLDGVAIRMCQSMCPLSLPDGTRWHWSRWLYQLP